MVEASTVKATVQEPAVETVKTALVPVPAAGEAPHPLAVQITLTEFESKITESLGLSPQLNSCNDVNAFVNRGAQAETLTVPDWSPGGKNLIARPGVVSNCHCPQLGMQGGRELAKQFRCIRVTANRQMRERFLFIRESCTANVWSRLVPGYCCELIVFLSNQVVNRFNT